MKSLLRCVVAVLALTGAGWTATKVHVVSFGKWMVVKWNPGLEAGKALDLKVRPLYVDARQKEFTTGAAHDVTDRLFVVRRAFRLNDALPEENGAPRWSWQRGGWLLVDRVTGRISQINLPEFDPMYSTASWYRDYAAYCGVSEDGKKLYAVVTQLGRRKPVLKKPLGKPDAEDVPDSECPSPTWERQPPRVTFAPDDETKLTYSIRGRIVDLVSEASEEEDEGSH